jgi:pimeloyl-ACP methyl ester carboxylesterase
MLTEDHWVTTPEGRLFVRGWGLAGRIGSRGPAIVLIHDSLGCIELWRDLPEGLAAGTGLPVIAYDRLGFGRSDPHPGHLADDFVETETATGLAPVARHLGCETLILMGHSVGGGMAIAAASQLSARCVAAVTLAAQAFVEEHTLAGIREAQEAFGEPGQVERLAHYHGDKAPWVLSAWFETWLRPSFAGYTLDGFLAKTSCPLLVLSADRDPYVSRRHPERMEAMAAGPVEMRIMENCGHVMHREYPKQVVSAVTRFLSARLSE